MAYKEVKLEILYGGGSGIDSANDTGVLDIYESENFPLSIQYGVKNIETLNDSKGSYTKTFDIPATKHNNKLLKHALKDNLKDITQFVDNSIKCRVRINGFVVLTGTFTIKGYQKGQKEVGYTITILGDSNNWTAIMDGKMMCELLDPDYHSVHNWDNGMWAWYNNNVTVDDVNHPTTIPTYTVCLPHICWGEYGYNHSIPTWKKMHLMEQTPSFFIKKLVYAFFKDAGYEVVSKFMEDKFFKKLIMPTDPTRFNHGNIQTLGGGQPSTTVVVAEANFYHDNGRGNSQATSLHNCGGYMSPNWKWVDCEETYPDPCYDPNKPRATVNHCKPLNQVSWSYSPPIADEYMGHRYGMFNEEIVDVYNTQDLYTSQWCAADEYGINGFSQNNAISTGEKERIVTHCYCTYPMTWHRWVCPATADYTITVEMSYLLYKWEAAVSDGRAKVKTNLVMIESASGWNYTDNTWTGVTAATNAGTETVLATSTVSTPSSQTHRTFHYKEVDLTWTGTIPAGAHIVVQAFNIRQNNSDFYSYAFVADRDFTKWDAAWETTDMTGTKARETKFKVTTGNGILYGDSVAWGDFLPCDITQKDFIGGLTGLFNLYWFTDEMTKKVYVEPYENFYTSKAEAVDWRKKMDLFTPHTTQFITDLIGRNALYRYQPPSKDGYQETLNASLEYPYHSQFVDLGAQYLNQTKEYGTTLFVPTIMVKDNQLVELIDANPPWIPLIVQEWLDDIGNYDKPERAAGYGIRILSYEGMQSTGTQNVWGSWANSTTSTYPRAVSYMTDGVVKSGQKHANLAYHDITVGGLFYEGLFTTYFDTLFQDLIALPRMKIAYFHLTPTDIAQLDLRRMVYITEDGGANSSYWKIHKIIDYKPQDDGLTKVELLQYQIKDRSQPTLATYSNVNYTRGQQGERLISPPSFSAGSSNVTATIDSPYPVATLRNPNQLSVERRTQGSSMVIRANNIAPRNNGNIVLGNNLISRLQNQVVLGRYNQEDNDALLIIGGGWDENNRRNVLTVKSDGSIELGGESTNLVTTDDTGAYMDLYTTVRRVNEGANNVDDYTDYINKVR